MAGSHGAGVSVCKDLLDEVVQPAHVELPHNVFSLVQLHLVFYQLVVTWSPMGRPLKHCTLQQKHFATRCSSRTHRVTESSSRFWSTSLRASLLPGLDSASRWQNMVGEGGRWRLRSNNTLSPAVAASFPSLRWQTGERKRGKGFTMFIQKQYKLLHVSVCERVEIMKHFSRRSSLWCF